VPGHRVISFQGLVAQWLFAFFMDGMVSAVDPVVNLFE
jgi:hypothetical protein